MLRKRKKINFHKLSKNKVKYRGTELTNIFEIGRIFKV